MFYVDNRDKSGIINQKRYINVYRSGKLENL